jgi:hypothetical protein
MVDSPSITYDPALPANTWQFRRMQQTTIVCHTIGGYFNELGNWFRDPRAVASTNFGVAQDGRISCFVDPFGPHSPYANGTVILPDAEFLRVSERNGDQNPNYWTVSIEHEDKIVPYTQITAFPAMFESSTLLSAWLCAKLNIDPKADGSFLGHYQIDGQDRRACPGWYVGTWDAYIQEVTNKMAGISVERFESLEQKVKRLEKLLAGNGIYINTAPAGQKAVMKWLFDEEALSFLARDGASAYQGLFELAGRVK